LSVPASKSPRALRGPLYQRGLFRIPPLEKGGLGGIYQQLLRVIPGRAYYIHLPLRMSNDEGKGSGFSVQPSAKQESTEECVAHQLFRTYPNNGCTCQVERSETSLFSGKCEILRFALNDSTMRLWLFE